MRMFVALLLTILAVVLQDCRGEDNAHCPVPPNCSPLQPCYEANGQCNNAKKYAGSEASPYSRYLTRLQMLGAPNYLSFFGQRLPPPRKVSLNVFPCHDGTASTATHLFAMFAKLLQLDMFVTERSSTGDSCCPTGCYGIDTNDVSDPRRVPCPCSTYKKPNRINNIECTSTNTEGKNKVTHVLDMSFMYSPVHYSGTLNGDGKFNLNSGFLPITGTAFNNVADDIGNNPLLMSLYHIFFREHNRLVDKLTPTCGTADCKKKAKKLLIAIFQHITYNEYLPMLLGDSTSVTSLPTGTRTYVPNSMPMVSNAFALSYKLVVASMMRETVTIDSTPNVNVNGMMNDATKVDTDAELTNIVKGLLTDWSLKVGRQIPCNFRNDCAYSDIVSVATQDARYLGIPVYYVWLYLATPPLPIPAVLDFPTLPLQGDPEKADLVNTYTSVYDIGFLSGALSENIVNGMLGTTLSKLFQDQFSALQVNDRLYYEINGVFTADQLEEIRKMSMAHLLCRNVNGLTEVKSDAFKFASPEVACSTLVDIDFCKYCGVSKDYGPYVSSTPDDQCQLYKIEVRTCLSTNPVVCPCVGNPLRITACPTLMITPEIMALFNLLQLKLNADEEAKLYAAVNNYEKLNLRAAYLFKQFRP